MATLPQRLPLEVPENDEPLLTFETGKPLVGATVTFVAKANEDVDDSTGVSIAGTVTDTTLGIFTVQLEDTVTGPAVGFKWYRIKVTIASHPVTWRYGPLVIINV